MQEELWAYSRTEKHQIDWLHLALVAAVKNTILEKIYKERQKGRKDEAEDVRKY